MKTKRRKQPTSDPQWEYLRLLARCEVDATKFKQYEAANAYAHAAEMFVEIVAESHRNWKQGRTGKTN